MVARVHLQVNRLKGQLRTAIRSKKPQVQIAQLEHAVATRIHVTARQSMFRLSWSMTAIHSFKLRSRTARSCKAAFWSFRSVTGGWCPTPTWWMCTK
jgi:hypothetical protein